MITNSISPKQLKVREYCTPSTTPRPYIRSYFKSPLHLMPIICTQQEDTLSYDKEICVMYVGETLERHAEQLHIAQRWISTCLC
jgi:hypothetical protein